MLIRLFDADGDAHDINPSHVVRITWYGGGVYVVLKDGYGISVPCASIDEVSNLINPFKRIGNGNDVKIINRDHICSILPHNGFHGSPVANDVCVNTIDGKSIYANISVETMYGIMYGSFVPPQEIDINDIDINGDDEYDPATDPELNPHLYQGDDDIEEAF
ncbi:MAG: hypothetical protein WC284_18675 [Candidimonas sp.]